MGRMSAPADGRDEDGIIDSSPMSPVDEWGNPIPVTIPIALSAGVRVVYTTRLGGVSEGDYADCNFGAHGGEDLMKVTANRMALSRTIGAPITLVSQVHSAVAVDADASASRESDSGRDLVDGDGQVLRADGLVSSAARLALGVFAADCMPVMLCDADAGVIAAAHCGRRGLMRGILRSTVDLMVSRGATPQGIVATLGPRICADCYEVGGVIADEFDARFPGTFTVTRFGGPGIDLAAAALQELSAAGVPRDNLIDSRPRVAAATKYLSQDEEMARLCREDGEGDPDLSVRIAAIRHSMCTLENPLWYSHRRAFLAGKAHEGRMLALVLREV